MSETTTLDRICQLHREIMRALPPEQRDLVNDLDELSNLYLGDVQELLIRTLMVHLPHRAAEILGAWEHIVVGTPDPSFQCCSAKRIKV